MNYMLKNFILPTFLGLILHQYVVAQCPPDGIKMGLEGRIHTTSILSYAAMMVFLAFVPYTLGIRKLWPMVR